MLLKNGERYTLTTADKKVVAKFFPKFPARLTYPPERVKKNTRNTKPDKPSSIKTPYFVSKKTLAGTETWRYYEYEHHLDGGRVKYTPTHMHLTGSMPITENDKELAFWLINASPYLKGGLNYNPDKVPKYAIENLIDKAEIEAAKKEKDTEFNTLIYNSQIGLPEDRLRQIASAMYIDGVKELTLPQVKLAVEWEVKRDKKEGVEKFLELAKAKQVLEIRSSIQKAIDNNLIKYNKSKKEWHWITDHGKKNELITKINPTVQENEALYAYYNGDANFAEQLLTSLKVLTEAEENEDTE